MAISARQLIFYVRAENQASGTLRRVARDFRGLRSMRDVQTQQQIQQLRGAQQIARARLNEKRIVEDITRAEAMRDRLGRTAAAGKGGGGFNAAEVQRLANAASDKVNRLKEEETLLQHQTDLTTKSIAFQKQQLDIMARAVPVERMMAGVQAAQHLGRALQISGLAVGASLGFAAHRAADFNSEIVLAATQARPLGSSIAATGRIATQLNDVVLQQMQRFPASSQEMADALYQIFSSTNVQGIKQGADLLEVFNRMAVAGGTDLKTMTDAGITIFNNFPDEFKNMTEAANAFFSAVRFGRMNAGQFAGSLASVVPIAKAAGLTFKDVADAMALLTRQTGGRFVSRDATGIARLIEFLARPESMKGLQQLGIEVQDSTGKMRPLLDIIDEIHKNVKNLRPGPETLNFFKQISAAGGGGGSRGFAGTVQARRAFSFLLTDIQEYHNVAQLVNQDTDEFVRSFEAMRQTPGVQWKVFMNQIKALTIVIGREAIPAFLELGRPIGRLVRWFNDLDNGTKHLIATVLVFGSVGALIGGTVLAIGGAIANLILTYKLWRISALATAAANGELAAASGALAAEAGAVNPIMAIGIAAMIAFSFAVERNPDLLNSMASSLGGVNNVLHLVIIALGAFSMAAVVRWLAATGLATRLMTGELAAARTALLGMSGLTIAAIAIPVYLVWHNKGDMSIPDFLFGGADKPGSLSNKIERKMRELRAGLKKGLGHGGFWLNADENAPLKGLATNLDLVDKNLPAVKRAADAAKQQGTNITVAMTTAERSQKRMDILTDRSARRRAAQFQQQNRFGQFGIGLQHFLGLQKEDNQLQRNVARWRAYDAAVKASMAAGKGVTPAAALGPTISVLMRNVIRLHKAAEAKPQDLQSWIRYFAAFTRLQKASGNNWQAVQQVLSNMEQTSTVPQVTAALVEQAKGVERIKKAAEQAPSIANWNRYYAALAALQKAGTSEAVAAAQEIASAQAVVIPHVNSQLLAAAQNVERLKAVANKAPTAANWNRYYAAVGALQKSSSSEAVQAAQEVAGAQVQATQQAQEKAKQLAQKNLQDFDSTVQSLLQKYRDFRTQAENEFGQLGQGPFIQGPLVQNRLHFGGNIMPQDLVTDLKSQVTRFSRFQGDLNRLAGRGIPRQLIDQLRAMGPEAEPTLRALSQASPKLLAQYTKVFRQSQKIIDAQTKRDFNAQLKQYQRFGNKVAQAIVQGIKDENPALQNAIRNTVISLFPALAKGAKTTPTPHAGTVNNYHTNVNVTTKEDSSLKTKVSHALFVSSHRYRGPR